MPQSSRVLKRFAVRSRRRSKSGNENPLRGSRTNSSEPSWSYETARTLVCPATQRCVNVSRGRFNGCRSSLHRFPGFARPHLAAGAHRAAQAMEKATADPEAPHEWADAVERAERFLRGLPFELQRFTDDARQRVEIETESVRRDLEFVRRASREPGMQAAATGLLRQLDELLVNPLAASRHHIEEVRRTAAALGDELQRSSAEAAAGDYLLDRAAQILMGLGYTVHPPPELPPRVVRDSHAHEDLG